MDRATITKGRAWRPLLMTGSCLALLLGAGQTFAAKTSDSAFRSGGYGGKTKQETVDADFRNLKFQISRKGRVTLLTEPVVRREFCTSVPVFTLDGATPTKPLSKRGAFAFTNTFEGTRIDKIKGQFVTDTRIEGTAVYNFQGQSDLCTPGSAKVEFTANRQKKKKS